MATCALPKSADLAARLLAAGLRRTRQRLAILRALLRFARPATIDEIHRSAPDAGDWATVFRCVKRFESSGLVRRAEFGDRHSRFEIACTGAGPGHHHHHLVCRLCGAVRQAGACEIRALESQVAKQFGFREVTHSLEFFGICPACARKAQQAKSRPRPRRPASAAAALAILALALFPAASPSAGPPAEPQPAIPQAEAAPAIPTFTLATFNAANWGPTDRFVDGKSVRNADKPASERAAVAAILRRMNPDILAVQEILQHPGDAHLKDFRETLARAGLDYPHMLTARGFDSRIQNALFSRFPMAAARRLTNDTYEATIRTGTGAKAKTSRVTRRVERGILNAVIQVNPHYQVEIFAVHLKSKRPIPELDDSGEPGDSLIRRNEALILRGHIMERYKADPEANVAAIGDFNDVLRSRPIQTIEGTKGDSVRTFNLWIWDWLGDQWTHFYYPERSYEKIDHIFASEGLFREFRAEGSLVYREHEGDPPELRWSSASDHRAVMACFAATNLPARGER